MYFGDFHICSTHIKGPECQKQTGFKTHPPLFSNGQSEYNL